MADEYRLDEVFNAKMIAEVRHRQAACEAHDVFAAGHYVYENARRAANKLKSVAPCLTSTYKAAATTKRKEAKHNLKILKAIMLVAIAASALSLGACAHHETAATTSSTTSSTRGYSK